MIISFWNIRNNIINSLIYELIVNNNIDILVLAECKREKAEKLINDLYKENLVYKIIEIAPVCKKIIVIYKEDIVVSKVLRDSSNHITININRNMLDFKLIALHLPSALYGGNENGYCYIQAIKRDIEEFDNVIVVGDFNYSPFDSFMVNASAFSAIPSKNISKRKVCGHFFKVLYNPMWNFFGDFSEIPGTYYYNNSADKNYYWYLLDQVLFTNDILKQYKDRSTKIIKKIGDKSLLGKTGINEKYSDHLPILFELKEENNGR